MSAPALRLFYDLSEGSKLHFRFDLDRSIFFVERYQLNIIFVLLIFFNISVTVQIEDSDIVSAKYSCGFSNLLDSSIIVNER